MPDPVARLNAALEGRYAIKPAKVLMLAGPPVASEFGIALAVGTAGGELLRATERAGAR